MKFYMAKIDTTGQFSIKVDPIGHACRISTADCTAECWVRFGGGGARMGIPYNVVVELIRTEDNVSFNVIDIQGTSGDKPVFEVI